MPGLDPGIHDLKVAVQNTWMAGPKPGHDDDRIRLSEP